MSQDSDVPVVEAQAGCAAGAPAAPPPPPTNRGGDTCKVLRFGVDSLYLSFPGEPQAEWDIRLKKAKELAQSPLQRDQALAQVTLQDQMFSVDARGSSLFAYTLDNPDYRFQVKSRTAKRAPLAYCKFSSLVLTRLGVPESVARLEKLLRELGEVDGPAKVSRLDLYVDFIAPYPLDDWHKDAWVGRGRSVNKYWEGAACSGWSIGIGGLLSARLYDKTLEITKSRKDYLKPLWEAAGWVPGQSVYRLEFQFRREVLQELGVSLYADLLAKLGALWAYASQDWLRLTVPDLVDQTSSRWPTHPMWQVLAAIDWGSLDTYKRIPSKSSAPDEKRLLDQYLAVLTSSMAVHGQTDPHEAAPELFEKTRDRFDELYHESGGGFDDTARERAARKAKDWKLPYPGSAQAARQLQDQAVSQVYQDPPAPEQDGE